MISFSRLFKNGRTLQAVLCISAKNFHKLSADLEKVWHAGLERDGRRHAPGGGCKSAVGGTAKQKLAFILFCLKVYPTFDLMGAELWNIPLS